MDVKLQRAMRKQRLLYKKFYPKASKKELAAWTDGCFCGMAIVLILQYKEKALLKKKGKK